MQEYPISAVNALLEAARVNQIHASIRMANDVAAGAVHALEALMGKGQPQALSRYIRGLQRSADGVQAQSRGKAEQQEADAKELFHAFGQVIEKKRTRGERTN